MLARAADLRQDTEYVAILASAWRKLQATDGGAEAAMAEALVAAGIHWAQQDRARAQLAAALAGPSWRGVRFREMALGCGIGDAFGAGVEFWDGRWIQRHVDGSAFVSRRGDPVLNFYYSGTEHTPDPDGAGQNFMPGMYTDDCEMSLGLMHALMAIPSPGPSAKDMYDYWRDEFAKARRHSLLSRLWSLAGVGRNGHGGIAAVYAGSQTLDSMRQRIRGMRYPGNAPPMRAMPLAFVAGDAALVRLARANADATHPHVKARAASLGIAVAARHFVLQHAAPEVLIAAVCAELSRLCKLDAAAGEDGGMVDDETLEYLQGVDSLPGPGPSDTGKYEDFLPDEALQRLCGPQPVWRGPADAQPDGRPRLVRGLNADAMRTLGCVLWLLKHHQAGLAMDTLLRSLYIGGDVDSLAALTLAMVGGREGLAFGRPGGLPVYMLQKLEAVEYIVETADSFERWTRVEHGKRSAACL